MFTEGEIATVRGKVRGIGDLLEAPLSGIPCVAYSAFVRVNEIGVMQWGNQLVTKVTDRRVVPFELETCDGVIYIDEPEVELALRVRPIIPRRLERERAFLAAHAAIGIDIRTSSFEERRVEPGMVVAVRGLALVDVDPITERGFRDAPSRRRIVPHDTTPLTIRSR